MLGFLIIINIIILPSPVIRARNHIHDERVEAKVSESDDAIDERAPPIKNPADNRCKNLQHAFPIRI